MATFNAQITALTGTTPNTTEASTWLTDGASNVITRLAQIDGSILNKFSQSKDLTSGGLPTNDIHTIMDVDRNSRESSPVEAWMRHRLDRSTSLMRATNAYPKHYILNDKLYVKPDPTSTATASASVVIKPSVSDTDESISNFADELEHAVVFYASMMHCVSLLSDLTISELDVESSVTVPTAPSTPSYTAISITLTTAPTYTGPTKSLNVSTAMGLITTYVGSDEDLEQAQAKINQVRAAVEDYVAEIQDSLNDFNEELQIYLTNLEKDVKEQTLRLDKEDREYMASIQRYVAQIQSYGQQVNLYVQEYASNLNRYATQTDRYTKLYTWLSTQYIGAINSYLPPTTGEA